MVLNIQQGMTAEQFDAWVLSLENIEQDFELIAGEVIEVVSHSYASYIAARFLLKIGFFVEAHQLGYFTGADGGYQVGNERYIPDVGFVSKQRHPNPPQETYIPIAPDLAIEVVSPTDREQLLSLKISNYLTAGTLVWVVYPQEQVVHVHDPKRGAYIVPKDGTLLGEAVLPGFELPLHDIFTTLSTDSSE